MTDAYSSDPSGIDPVERLWTEVIRVWELRGRPHFSEIEQWSINTKQSHRLSRGTLSDWFQHRRMPKDGWSKFCLLLLFLDVDTEQWRKDLWLPAERFVAGRNGRGRAQSPAPSSVDSPNALPAGPTDGGPSESPSRVFTRVRVVTAPVFTTPDESGHPLKHKYQGDRIELVSGIEPRADGTTTYWAVRTPRERAGIAWMRAADLDDPDDFQSSRPTR
ncbi:hypothetical protein [Acrocarpospora catenulata]|uniref:hypothetical protein n=1 Tax=Acrocarpospora catenulata TaxID=2836182 RepID=UPI001BDB1B0A|nr:hypothetical protein [Acrocarpospora catenulata]